MKLFRVTAFVFGVLILVIGVSAIVFDVASKIGQELNTDPNFRAISTFPMGTLFGLPCAWLGYRLVFTKPLRARLPIWRRRPASN